MTTSASDNLAVLIDADNAQASVITELVGEVARYGTATVKRAYGDWTTQNLVGWKDVLHVHAIQPVQQFRYTTGKNATDSALIIDAMDLLHGGKVDGFCLVSSDSDFTRLATRIREAGLAVYGFGEQKTPKPFVAACDKFVYTEILRKPAAGSATPVQVVASPIKALLNSAISAAAQEDGWALLGAVGALVLKNEPSFDPRNFGFKKLGELVKAQPYLDVKTASTSEGSQHMHLFVKNKDV
jgi:NYN domain/OST-HTH/LOTUS domain